MASTVLNITTKGDAVQDRSLAAIGSDSLFVQRAGERRCATGRADYAVHSCKDLPSTLPDDMDDRAAITEREDPRDAFCSERVSPRSRTCRLVRSGRHVQSAPARAAARATAATWSYDDIRGNVDTRLRKLKDRRRTPRSCWLARGCSRLGVGCDATRCRLIQRT